MSKEWEPENVFDVLGSEVARQILALASLRPLSATELAEHCDVSEPTIHRRIHALQVYAMLDEQTELDGDGHHSKQFRTNLKEARFQVDDGQFDIDIQLKKDYRDKFTDFWSDLEEGTKDISKDTNVNSSHRDNSSSDLSSG